jgi:cystine transport system substrate-binding protein
MKLFKFLLINLTFATAANLTSFPVYAADLLDTVKTNGELKVGLEGTYPPFGYLNGDGQLDGFDVAVAKNVASRMGLKIRFITTEWTGAIAGLEVGKFDVIVNQVAITPQREQTLSFSQPYIFSAAQLIQRADDKRDFKSLNDLKSYKVGVVIGTNFASMVKTVPEIQVVTYPGESEVLRDLATGRLDAGIDDRLMLPYLIKTSNLPLRAGALLDGAKLEMGIPFRKGNPQFAKAIDEAIGSMKRDGTLRKLSIQWFGTDTSQPIMQ